MWKLTSSIRKKADLCLPSTSEMGTVMAGWDPATVWPPLTSGGVGRPVTPTVRSAQKPRVTHCSRLPGPPAGALGFFCPSDKKSSSVGNDRRIFFSLFFFFLSRHLSSKQIPEIKNVIVVNMVSACCKYEADAHVESWAVSPLSIPQWSGRSLQMPLCPSKGTPLPTPKHAHLSGKV